MKNILSTILRFHLLLSLWIPCSPATGGTWPCWRGPTGSGSAADYPGEVIHDIAEARWIWNGENRSPVEYNGTCSKLTGSGCVSPVFWSNRVYLVYHSASELRRLDAKQMGHTYVRPGQKPIILTPERRKKMTGGYCGAKGQHTAKIDGKSPYTEEMAENFLFNIYNDNVAVCMDADTGRILWKNRWLSHFKGQTGSYHNSPCIHAGKLYFLAPGMTRVMCVDALTGELLWDHYNNERDFVLSQAITMRKRLLSRYKKDMGNAGIQHSIVVAGYLVCAAGTFDADTGERIRDGSSVATRWIHRGKQYLMSGNSCIDVRTGKTLWSVKGVSFGMGRNSGGNPPLTEDHMAAWTRKGWTGYRISPEGAEEIWNIPGLKKSTGAAVIHKGYAVTGGSDEKGRLLIAVEVATGKIAGKLYYDQKGSKNFDPSPLNNLWCGITSAVAMDGHVFWRRYRSGGGGLTMMTLPVDGREFSVSIKDGPLLGYSHTPAAGDGRLFVRMKGYMRCLDFRKDPPPARVWPPDPACKGLKGAVAKLGSSYKSERDGAVVEFVESADAAMASDLVKLVTAGRYTTARAAAQVLAEAADMKPGAPAVLRRSIEKTGAELPATRLALLLHALHSTAPKDAAVVTRAMLGEGRDDHKLLARVGDALAEPVFADDIELIKAVLPDLKAALAKADPTALEAIGHALGCLDLEPKQLTPLLKDLMAVLKRTKPAPFTIQRALLLGLEGCENRTTFKDAAEFVLETWPKKTHRGWDGSTRLHMAALKLLPGDVAQAALPKLVAFPGRDVTVFKRIGEPAIDALVEQYPTSGRNAKRILELLRKMGPEGEKAAAELKAR